MRNLFIIGMLLVGAFMAGWFKINREGDQTTISINRSEIRQDTRKAIDRGREILDRQQERLAREEEQPFDSRFDERMSYPPASTLTDSRRQPDDYRRDAYQDDRLRTADRSPYQQAEYRDNYRQPTSERGWDATPTHGRPSESAFQDRYRNDTRYREDLRYSDQPQR